MTAPSSPVEVLVKTGGPVTRFSVVAVTSPRTLYSVSPDFFFDEDTVTGADPLAGTPFAVMQEHTDGVGLGRILGLTKVRVEISDIAHRYADCVTGDTTKLASAERGPARIIWTESTFGLVGLQWTVVNLLGHATEAPGGAGSGARVKSVYQPPPLSQAPLGQVAVYQNVLTTDETGLHIIVGSFNYVTNIPGGQPIPQSLFQWQPGAGIQSVVPGVFYGFGPVVSVPMSATVDVTAAPASITLWAATTAGAGGGTFGSYVTLIKI